MRTVILPSVLENLKRNLNNQAGEVKIFEISKTYYQNRNGIEERQKLCLAASVELESELWDKRKYDFFDLKNLLAGFRIPHAGDARGLCGLFSGVVPDETPRDRSGFLFQLRPDSRRPDSHSGRQTAGSPGERRVRPVAGRRTAPDPSQQSRFPAGFHGDRRSQGRLGSVGPAVKPHPGPLDANPRGRGTNQRSSSAGSEHRRSLADSHQKTPGPRGAR